MSAALLGAAMKAKLGSRTRKLVLIKLVDCCHEDGTNIYPALATVAEDAECSIATARRTLKEFVAVGLLRKVRDGGGGRKSTNHYEMDVELLLRLRRPEFWPALEAAALHQPLPDEGDEDEVGHAQDAAAGPERAAPCEIKGSTVIPYHGDTLSNDALRVSSGDTQPLSRSLNSERESAGAGAGTPASEAEPAAAGHAPDAGGEPATLAAFREAYPHAGADDQAMLASAWEALPFEQRRAAIAGIAGFLAERKAAGLTSRLSAPKYLAGRNWLHLPRQSAERAAAQAAGAVMQIGAWSGDWWLLLLDRVFAGRPAGMWVQFAEAGKALSATSADIAAAGKRIGELKPFLCDGPEIKAWRPWLAARGARIPVFSGSFRVFLPAEAPPGGRRDDGDDDVRF